MPRIFGQNEFKLFERKFFKKKLAKIFEIPAKNEVTKTKAKTKTRKGKKGGKSNSGGKNDFWHHMNIVLPIKKKTQKTTFFNCFDFGPCAKSNYFDFGPCPKSKSWFDAQIDFEPPGK